MTSPSTKRRKANEIMKQIQTHQPLPDPRLLTLHQTLPLWEREKYVEFIAEVCDEFDLQSQTAGLAVTYFDRYFSRVPRCSPAYVGVELAAITCILISAKFLQFHVPAIADMCTLCRREPCTWVELKKAELRVLSVLGWDLHALTPHVVLEQLFVIVGASPASERRAEFFVDMSYYEYRILQYTPVTIAAASLMAAWSQLGDLDSEATHTKVLAEICDVELPALFKCKGVLVDHFNSVFRRPSAGEKTADRSESPDTVCASLDSLSDTHILGVTEKHFAPVGC